MRSLGHAVLGCLVVATIGFVTSRAGAATLQMRAPESCVEAESVGDQVEGLLGQPLTSVAGVDFEVSIERGVGREWRLRLDTLDKEQGKRRSRELTAKSCAELADAAAVAITMSIKSLADREPRARQPHPAAAVVAAPTAVAVAPRAEEAPPAPTLSRAAALTALVDSGAMPRAALGLGLEVALQRGGLRVLGSGTFFPSQQATLPNGVGGTFQLATGGALACLAQGLGRVTLLGCVGGEVGRLTGEGVGVSAPRARGTLWLAGRGDLGATFALAPNVAVVARAGAAVPLQRPTFLLNNDTAVHRPASLTVRATFGVELAF